MLLSRQTGKLGGFIFYDMLDFYLSLQHNKL